MLRLLPGRDTRIERQVRHPGLVEVEADIEGLVSGEGCEGHLEPCCSAGEDEIEADEVGASLKWATAKVERSSQRGNGNRAEGRERQAERGGDFNDPAPF
jgi:hypothetical protein